MITANNIFGGGAAAVAMLHRILKPGGIALVTTAGITKIGRRLGRDPWGEYPDIAQQLEARFKPVAALRGTVYVMRSLDE